MQRAGPLRLVPGERRHGAAAAPQLLAVRPRPAAGPAPAHPGDLLFFAEPGGPIHHVGIYLGGGAMLHAERTGTLVRILPDVLHNPYWGPRFVGASRPQADPQPSGPVSGTDAPDRS
ncbi:C40 family peptidase [Streptacidiphilus sp. 4-A2]|nr:C40 family peptidase [Streptacidiphilus sp. 4-A2]